MNYKLKCKLEELSELEFSIFSCFEKLITDDIELKREEKSINFDHDLNCLNGFINQENRLLDYYKNNSSDCMITWEFLKDNISFEQSVDPIYNTIHVNTNTFVKIRLLNLISIILNRYGKDKELKLVAEFKYSIDCNVYLNLEKELIENGKNPGSDLERYFIETKYYLAYLVPLIDKELIKNKFNNVHPHPIDHNVPYNEVLSFFALIKIEACKEIMDNDDDRKFKIIMLMYLKIILNNLDEAHLKNLKEQLLNGNDDEFLKELFGDDLNNEKGNIL